MKFSHEGDCKMIFKNTKEYINNIEKEIINFKEFCNSIANETSPSVEAYLYYDFTKKCDNMYHTLIKDIQEPMFKLQQRYNDKYRPSVLYLYEKQAIYQYLNKFDFKKHCSKKCGCMYAEKILKDGKEIVTIGFSVCNDKDEFSKNIALNLAKKRAREYPARYGIRVTSKPVKFPSNDILRIPYKWMYEGELAKFVKRCTKWFKNETIIYPNNIDFVEFPKKKKEKSDKITNKPMPF